MLSKQTKLAVVESYKKGANDTGSAEVQIGLLTKQIKVLSEHLRTHKKDKHSRRGLVMMVDQRRKFLKYLKVNKPAAYEKIMKKIEE